MGKHWCSNYMQLHAKKKKKMCPRGLSPASQRLNVFHLEDNCSGMK